MDELESHGKPGRLNQVSLKTLQRFAAGLGLLTRALVPVALVLVSGIVLLGLVAIVVALFVSHGIKWVLLGIGLGAVVCAAWLGWRLIGMWRGASNQGLLVQDFLELSRLNVIGDHIVTQVTAVVSPSGGARLWSRAVGAWRLLNTIDVVEEHVLAREHARHFLPPMLLSSQLLLVLSFWLAAASIVGCIVVPLLSWWLA